MPRRTQEQQFPLGAGRIRQLGWSIFRFAWRSIITALAVCLVPALVLHFAVDATIGNRVYEWFAEAGRATQYNLPQPARPANFDIAVIAIVLATIVQFLASLVASAAVVAIVDRVYRGGALSGPSAARVAIGRVLSLLGGQLLMFVAVAIVVMIGLVLAATFFLGGGLLVFLGLVVLVGILAAILFILVRATLTTVAVVVDEVGGTEGFTRSWRLVADNGWRILGYLVLIGLIEFLVTAIVAGIPVALDPLPVGSTEAFAVSTLAYAVAGILSAPIAPIVLTLLYYDLRWRHGETVPLAGGGEVQGLPQVEQQRPR